jgi:hypothetical protein
LREMRRKPGDSGTESVWLTDGYIYLTIRRRRGEEKQSLDHLGFYVDDVEQICRAAEAKMLIIFHHDPDHEDLFMERLESEARYVWPNALVAREGLAYFSLLAETVFAAQGLRHELRQHPSVVQPHPRTVGVKNTDDARVESVLAHIHHRQGLRKTFRFIVTGARAGAGYVSPETFGGRNVFGLRDAVNLAAGEEQEAFDGEAFFLLRGGIIQKVSKPDYVRVHRLYRMPAVEGRGGYRGGVDYVIEVAQSGGVKTIDVFNDKSDLFFPGEFLKPMRDPPDEIVHADDAALFRKGFVGVNEEIYEVIPQKTRAPRDEERRARKSADFFADVGGYFRHVPGNNLPAAFH